STATTSSNRFVSPARRTSGTRAGAIDGASPATAAARDWPTALTLSSSPMLPAGRSRACRRSRRIPPGPPPGAARSAPPGHRGHRHGRSARLRRAAAKGTPAAASRTPRPRTSRASPVLDELDRVEEAGPAQVADDRQLQELAERLPEGVLPLGHVLHDLLAL